jgi:hypothetical protein
MLQRMPRGESLESTSLVLIHTRIAQKAPTTCPLNCPIHIYHYSMHKMHSEVDVASVVNSHIAVVEIISGLESLFRSFLLISFTLNIQRVCFTVLTSLPFDSPSNASSTEAWHLYLSVEIVLGVKTPSQAHVETYQ